MLAELGHGCPGREALFPEPLSRAGVGKKAGELCHVGDVNVLCQALGEPPGQCYCGKIKKGQSLSLPRLALRQVQRLQERLRSCSGCNHLGTLFLLL